MEEVVEIKRKKEEKPEMVKEWERTKLAWVYQRNSPIP